MSEIISCITCDQCKKKYLDERAVNEEKVFNTLKSMYTSFCSNFTEETLKPVRLDRGLLFLVVKSYFDDIYRFKDYTGSKSADRHKQAAYLIKWISKLRPIQIVSEITPYSNEIIWINSSFSLYVGLIFLDVPNIFASLSDSMYETLMYTTQYRYISGKQLSPLLYLIEKEALL